MLTGEAIYVCSLVALYSTGHWIGATCLLALLVLVKAYDAI